MNSSTTSSHTLRIAMVTPSYNRAIFLNQAYACFRAQVLAPGLSHGVLAWFVLDDSPQRQDAAWCDSDVSVHYHWQSTRIALGAKRNQLNDLALEWGADIVCSMDDDDWYGADYASSMTQLLLSSDFEMAGSGDDYLYDIRTDRILKMAATGAMTSCNGVLCYKTSILPVARYSDAAHFGEEPAFIGKRKILQHPAVHQVHLAVAHANNTATKKNYLINPACATTLTLEDLPMTMEDKAFYRSLVR